MIMKVMASEGFQRTPKLKRRLWLRIPDPACGGNGRGGGGWRNKQYERQRVMRQLSQMGGKPFGRVRRREIQLHIHIM